MPAKSAAVYLARQQFLLFRDEPISGLTEHGGSA